MSLSLNDTASDFVAGTTQGTIRFHEWISDGWAILFSQPEDFTPVCATEVRYMAGLQAEFEKRNCKIIGPSLDPTTNLSELSEDIQETEGRKRRASTAQV